MAPGRRGRIRGIRAFVNRSLRIAPQNPQRRSNELDAAFSPVHAAPPRLVFGRAIRQGRSARMAHAKTRGFIGGLKRLVANAIEDDLLGMSAQLAFYAVLSMSPLLLLGIWIG